MSKTIKEHNKSFHIKIYPNHMTTQQNVIEQQKQIVQRKRTVKLTM